MESYFKGKCVLITGAGRGLGREMALQCGLAGARVVAVARSQNELETLKKDVEALPGNAGVDVHACDVTDRSAFGAVLSRSAPIDIAILNAGVKHGDGAGFSGDKVLETFDVNFESVVRALEDLLPPMRARGEGHLVFISSLGGYHGMVRAHGYNASKAALSILADSLRMDLWEEGADIAVTVVKPGLIRTPMTKASFLSLSAAEAARIALKGVAKRKKEVAFPALMRLLSMAVPFLPKKIAWGVFRKMKGAKNGNGS